MKGAHEDPVDHRLRVGTNTLQPEAEHEEEHSPHRNNDAQAKCEWVVLPKSMISKSCLEVKVKVI